jgi:hypothetical protein
MSQIFHPSTNTIARATIFGAIFVLFGVAWVSAQMYRSSWRTEVHVAREQPVPFSHEHHVAGLGIDCRYCHTTVETSHFAGIPNTKTCMTCHSQVWNNAPMLAPVRESWTTNEPIRWNRVHDLPDFAHFNHSIHVAKGVGCSTCHGQVDKMPLMWKENSLQMEWCLQCHRNPEKYVRPREEIFNMQWPPPGWDQAVEGPKLVEKYGILKSTQPETPEGHERQPNQLTNCSVCHY